MNKKQRRLSMFLTPWIEPIMTKVKSVFDESSADKQQIGFEYQDLVCLEYLIDLKPGEEVGVEVFDDIHYEKISGEKSLIQVKHSILESGSLTNSDVDLWKTLKIWDRALEELNSTDTELVFFTNKKITLQNGLIKLIASESKDINAISVEIANLKKSLDDKDEAKKVNLDKTYVVNPVKEYVDYIYHLSTERQNRLFTRINILSSNENILERLHNKIINFAISAEKALDVVSYIIGEFKKEKYKLVKESNKITFTYDSFRIGLGFNRIIQFTQDRKIDFSRYSSYKRVNDINPKSGVFAKQLSEINISEDEINDYAIDYAGTCMYIQSLIAAGDFSEVENLDMNSQVLDQWKILYRSIFNDINTEISTEINHQNVARNCLYEAFKSQIEISNSKLVSSMIIGKNMELSDTPVIGWRKDWQAKYGSKS